MSFAGCFLGDSCFLYSWGDEISLELSRRVLRAYRAVKSDPRLRQSGLLDAVPAYSSLAVYFDPVAADIPGLLSRAEELIRISGESGTEDSSVPDRTQPGSAAADSPGLGSAAVAPPGLDSAVPEPLRLPVVYDGDDLGRVASHAGLAVEEVIRRHTRPNYTVAMIGFLPHFPYLIGMDERLVTPRRSTPRTRVPAGSVAIGGAQTGIYPSESPGGWNLIGRTDPRLLLGVRPGDTIVFEKAEKL
jgi:KipI family sensor histidine kinase inhibitor